MIDFELSEGVQTMQKMVHAVAEQAMRPIAREYDEREHEKRPPPTAPGARAQPRPPRFSGRGVLHYREGTFVRSPEHWAAMRRNGMPLDYGHPCGCSAEIGTSGALQYHSAQARRASLCSPSPSPARGTGRASMGPG